ncbi:TraB/GumN family protein [Vagococcus elongatus]|uniref:TraB/GumN family protein n=1 Tax=Vagococcus elongatus TaxID=180344 RepID=A0A430B4K3_9ENTE|nr:TraB/GumN family protein [Vagococcus elongatus]RSU15255.1 hypothetical protein CBF29_02675 [Vagococcus elongatus]
MNNKKVRLWAAGLLLSLGLFGGCASKEQGTETQEVTDQSEKQLAVDEGKKQLEVKWPYYEIIKDGQVQGYLLGTIHVGKQSMYPFPERILGDLEKSFNFITEIKMSEFENPETGEKAQEAMAAEEPLTTNMTDDAREKYQEILKDYGYQEKDVASMNRFGVSQMLQAKVLPAVAATYGVDMQLSAHAKKNKNQKNIGLETVAFQYQVLPKMYEEPEDINAWIETLETKEKYKEAMDELLQAYVDGKISEIYENPETSGMSSEQNEILLVNRNMNWIEQLPEYLQKENQSFIAVGAGHLPGEKGLLNLLSQAGYETSLVTFE